MTDVQNVGCVKAATKILGDKWTPLLLRAFFSTERVRFCALQDSAEGINPRTLSARLVMLEENGIIKKDGDAKRCEYTLTTKGRDFLPVLKQMETWGKKYDHTQLSGNTQQTVLQ